MTMSLRRLLNGVYGLLVDGCEDEAARDALDESLIAEPEPDDPVARVLAAGGEIG